MARKLKSDMMSEINKVYKDILYLKTLDRNPWLQVREVADWDRFDEVKARWEETIAIKPDVDAMVRCLNRVVAKRREALLDGLKTDYHVTELKGAIL